MDGELASIARDLYSLPLEEFVAARTEAAKSAAGTDKALATAVRALPKPSVAAWAVNMLAVHHPEAVVEVTELGQSMRAAQNALDAGAMRELGQERRRVLSKVMETVRSVAEKQGRNISDAVADEIEETLRAATADYGAAAAVRSGQLLKVLSANGVDQVDVHSAVAVQEVLGEIPQNESAAPGAPMAKLEKRQPSGKPRLQAVPSTRRVDTPSALEKATAGLAEAEEATRTASEEAVEAKKRLKAADEALTRLSERTRRLKEDLKILEGELESVRKERDAAAIAAQQASRSADKQSRVEELARQRVLRLRNTQN